MLRASAVIACLREARTGERGLGRWLLVHGCLHLLLLCISAFVNAVIEIPLKAALDELPYTALLSIPIIVLPTVLLTAVTWVLRGLRPLVFHAIALGLALLPLTFLSEPRQLALLAPVQVVYALLIGQPKEIDWSEPA